MTLFPADSAERKTYPIYSGLLAYFPAALAAVAHHSFVGNEQHHPGAPLHWDRAKSGDELDAATRHIMEGEYVAACWRLLAVVQKQREAEGAPIAPGARNATVAPDATPPELTAETEARAYADTEDFTEALNAQTRSVVADE